MNRVAVPMTYRIEEWSVVTGQVLGTYGQHMTNREAALTAFRVLVDTDRRTLRLYQPGGPRRLVLLGSPATSAPINAEATADLAAVTR